MRIQIDTTSLQVVNAAFDTANNVYSAAEHHQTTNQCIRSFVNAVIFATERHIPLPGQHIGKENETIGFWNTPPEGVNVVHLKDLQLGIHRLHIDKKVIPFGSLLDFAGEQLFRSVAPRFLCFQAQPSITEEFLSRRRTWSEDFLGVIDELRTLAGRQNVGRKQLYDETINWADTLSMSQRHQDILSEKTANGSSTIRPGEYLFAFFWDWYQRGYQYRPSTRQEELFAYSHPLRIYGGRRGQVDQYEKRIDFGNAVVIHKSKIIKSSKGEVGSTLEMISKMAQNVRSASQDLAIERTEEGAVIPNRARQRFLEIMCDSYRLKKGDILELKPEVKSAVSRTAHSALQRLLFWTTFTLIPQPLLERVTQGLHSRLMTLTTWYPAAIDEAHNKLIDVAMSRLTFGHEWSLVDVAHLSEISTASNRPN